MTKKRDRTVGKCFICKRKLKGHEVSSPTGDVVAIRVKVNGEECLVCLEHRGVEELRKCRANTK